MKMGSQNSGGLRRMLHSVRVLPYCVLSLLLGFSVQGGPFQNLDFESSPWFPPGDYSYPFTIYPSALPGWTVHIGDAVQDGAWANEYILDVPGVALLIGPPAIEGGKSVYLQSVGFPDPIFGDPSLINVAISQVGDIPSDATFLYFDAYNQWYDSFPIPPGPFEVSLGGTALSLIPTSSNGGHVRHAADISPWAGQTTELSIKVLASGAWGNPYMHEGWAVVDSIVIPSSVPEPSVIALTVFGGLLLASLRCRNTGNRLEG